ncbi:thioredoxin family protein [Kaarinaea lacus]
MTSLLLLILIIVSLAILIRWRVQVAQKKLEGIAIPEMGNLPVLDRNTEGAIYYFYHPRCGPCKSMLPIIDDLVRKFPDRVVKLNITDNRELVHALNIRSTPTTVLVKNNRIIKAIIGATSYNKVEAMLTLPADNEASRQKVKEPGGD